MFPEIVNWALVWVRAYNVPPPEEVATIAEQVEPIMIDNRGFARFSNWPAYAAMGRLPEPPPP